MDLRYGDGQGNSFVALTDTLPDGYRAAGEPRYIGSARTAPPTEQTVAMHPGMSMDALVICDLCVSAPYRGMGVGKNLIDHALRTNSAPETYLQIAKQKSSCADIHSVFKDRVDRLQATYAQLGFVRVAENDDSFLLRYGGK